MTRIEIRALDGGDPLRFAVILRDEGSETRHEVSLSKRTLRELGGEGADARACVEAAFRFLLDHEPKENILRRFDIPVIGSYFPDFAAEFPHYLRH